MQCNRNALVSFCGRTLGTTKNVSMKRKQRIWMIASGFGIDFRVKWFRNALSWKLLRYYSSVISWIHRKHVRLTWHLTKIFRLSQTREDKTFIAQNVISTGKRPKRTLIECDESSFFRVDMIYETMTSGHNSKSRKSHCLKWAKCMFGSLEKFLQNLFVDVAYEIYCRAWDLHYFNKYLAKLTFNSKWNAKNS